MKSLNCIASDESIIQIKEQNANPDTLKTGFEFGTWNFPPYYEFFRLKGKINKEDLHNNYVFTETEKQKIKKALAHIIKQWDTKHTNHTDGRKTQLNILKKTPWKECGTICRGKNNKTDHNLCKEHVKILLKHDFYNPLKLTKKKYYKKLYTIFSGKEIQLISM